MLYYWRLAARTNFFFSWTFHPASFALRFVSMLSSTHFWDFSDDVILYALTLSKDSKNPFLFPLPPVPPLPFPHLPVPSRLFPSMTRSGPLTATTGVWRAIKLFTCQSVYDRVTWRKYSLRWLCQFGEEAWPYWPSWIIRHWSYGRWHCAVDRKWRPARSTDRRPRYWSHLSRTRRIVQ